MTPVWQELLIVFGGNAALLATCAYLIKSLLTHRLSKDLKVFEAELQAKANGSIEQLKHSLEVLAAEHQVRFSKLHEKRADVIAELYKLLVEAFWAAQSFVSPMEFGGEKSKPEKHQEAITKLREFFTFFGTHRIYLPESICKLLDKAVDDVGSHVIDFGVYVTMPQPPGPGLLEGKMETWIRAYQILDKEIPVARKAIEGEFRRILEGDA
jgi:hypothetical protein